MVSPRWPAGPGWKNFTRDGQAAGRAMHRRVVAPHARQELQRADGAEQEAAQYMQHDRQGIGQGPRVLGHDRRATAQFDDEVAALQEAGVQAAFNFYAEAGAGFAEHVCERLEGQLAR